MRREREVKGRRFYYRELGEDERTGGGWFWVTWRLFERMSGVATTEEGAQAAVEHFLESPGASYKLV